MCFHNHDHRGAASSLVFGAWFLGWAGTLFLSSTRVIFAAAFDRILPEKVADVSEKRHVPVWALVLMLVPSIMVSALYAYTTQVRDLHPRRDAGDRGDVLRDVDRGDHPAVAKEERCTRTRRSRSTRSAGIPLITITGSVTALFLGWNLYKWFTATRTYAVNNKQSLMLHGLDVRSWRWCIYVVAKVYRKSQGIDLKAVYEEIPVE